MKGVEFYRMTEPEVALGYVRNGAILAYKRPKKWKMISYWAVVLGTEDEDGDLEADMCISGRQPIRFTLFTKGKREKCERISEAEARHCCPQLFDDLPKYAGDPRVMIWKGGQS